MTIFVAHLIIPAAAAAKSLQSCPTLCDPIDGSSPGSPVPGILQARTLEWVAISFSNAWKWKVKMKSLSCVQLLAAPRTAAHQAPLPVGFSRQEYWSGVPLPSPMSYWGSFNKVTSWPPFFSPLKSPPEEEMWIFWLENFRAVLVTDDSVLFFLTHCLAAGLPTKSMLFHSVK